MLRLKKELERECWGGGLPSERHMGQALLLPPDAPSLPGKDAWMGAGNPGRGVVEKSQVSVCPALPGTPPLHRGRCCATTHPLSGVFCLWQQGWTWVCRRRRRTDGSCWQDRVGSQRSPEEADSVPPPRPATQGRQTRGSAALQPSPLGQGCVLAGCGTVPSPPPSYPSAWAPWQRDGPPTPSQRAAHPGLCCVHSDRWSRGQGPGEQLGDRGEGLTCPCSGAERRSVLWGECHSRG